MKKSCFLSLILRAGLRAKALTGIAVGLRYRPSRPVPPQSLPLNRLQNLRFSSPQRFLETVSRDTSGQARGPVKCRLQF